jgi:multidrug efflux system membrane fusion protein
MESAKGSILKSKWWLGAAFVTLVGLGLYILIPRMGLGQSKAQTKDSKKSGKGGDRTLPVSAVATHKGDIAVYVTGLGSVTAYNTVTIKTRVDGQLDKVAFTEGQMLNQGDLVVEIDPRPYQVMLTQAEGQMARDQATLDNARIDLKRYQHLIETSAITKQQLDTQEATVKQGEGTVKNDQGVIDSAQLQLTYCRITAPISGRIGLRTVDQGNIVHAADTTGLAVITQLQPIAMIFNMPEDDLPEVQRAMGIRHALPAEAWDRDLQHKLSNGMLLTLDNQIDPTSGTVRVKLEFANKDNKLFPNQFVNAKLLVDTKRNVVLAPGAAIQRGPNSTFVYVVKPDQTIELRNVTTGATDADQVEIAKGVKPGELLVTEGADKLRQGVKVAVRKPAAGQGAQADGGEKGVTQ